MNKILRAEALRMTVNIYVLNIPDDTNISFEIKISDYSPQVLVQHKADRKSFL